MDPKDTGIVNLQDLPQKEIFIVLEKDFFNSLEDKIKKLGIYKLARELNISKSILCHWIMEGSLMRLDILIIICAHFRLELESKIAFMRGKDGNGIKNPKLPFDFTSCEGVRVIASILGDGSLPKNRNNPNYSNTNPDLVKGFIDDVKFVFGDIYYAHRRSIKKNSTVNAINLPAVSYKTFLSLGLKKGKKVASNQGCPEFIFSLPLKQKFSFLAQFFDDEGSASVSGKNLNFSASCMKYHKYPKILKDIKKILSEVDIKCNIFSPKEYEYSYKSKEENTKRYKLQIDGQIHIQDLAINMDLRSQGKIEKINKILSSYKLKVFRKSDIIERYIEFIEEIEEEKGYFTSLDLARISGRNIGSCRNLITKFKKLDLIKCIKNSTSGDYHEYGEYVIA